VPHISLNENVDHLLLSFVYSLTLVVFILRFGRGGEETGPDAGHARGRVGGSGEWSSTMTCIPILSKVCHASS
jgi:hypothetical protein